MKRRDHPEKRIIPIGQVEESIREAFARQRVFICLWGDPRPNRADVDPSFRRRGRDGAECHGA
jgi:hypothetical protein